MTLNKFFPIIMCRLPRQLKTMVWIDVLKLVRNLTINASLVNQVDGTRSISSLLYHKKPVFELVTGGPLRWFLLQLTLIAPLFIAPLLFCAPVYCVSLLRPCFCSRFLSPCLLRQSSMYLCICFPDDAMCMFLCHCLITFQVFFMLINYG